MCPNISRGMFSFRWILLKMTEMKDFSNIKRLHNSDQLKRIALFFTVTFSTVNFISSAGLANG